MTLTDEEAKWIVAALRSGGECMWCGGSGQRCITASVLSPPTMDRCGVCDGTGVGLPEARRLITLLESRIGT